MSEERSHWRVHLRRDEDLVAHLCRLRGLDPLALTPDYLTQLHDPFLLPDMVVACALIKRAIDEDWHVTIFGDYDADGTPAAALLSLALSAIGLRHSVRLPTRDEGYGLRLEQIKEIAKSSKLLITVDTGISSVEEMSVAKAAGMSVIILDHHLPGKQLPDADAIVDPHRHDSSYPFPHLCGCALAYKLVVALGQQFPQLDERFSKWLLDLVAVSTVADMMPLVDENRTLVHYGLVVLRQNRRLGLRALLATAGVDPLTINAGTLGFVVGPRLNAAGRLGDNRPAFDLLIANDEEKAARLAAKIEKANSVRQELVQRVLTEATAEIEKQNDQSDFALLVAKEGWPAGVVGLVAGKFLAQFHRPVFVATNEGDQVRGSARSLECFPVVEALSAHRDLLTSFGGHVTAAGFSLPVAKWSDFARSIKQLARSQLKASQLRPTFSVDAELGGQDLLPKTAKKLEQLAPFGLGNTRPLFLLRGAALDGVRRIGRDEKHVKGRILIDGAQVDVIAFGLAGELDTDTHPTLHAIGYLEMNRWNDREYLQFQIVDYRTSDDTLEWIS